MSNAYDYDMLVVGSGPAGQKAAIQAAKAGKRVALVERDNLFGGACVHRGTIPSKTLRENALRVSHMRQNAALADFELTEDVEMSTLITRLNDVLVAHDMYMSRQIDRNGIDRIKGRASFIDNETMRIDRVQAEPLTVSCKTVVLATGSYPRNPPNMPIDHENVLDSDSILSLLYLPKSLTVLGGGVIASEYASIFQALGVKVTMIDKYPKPLGFLDHDLCDTFVKVFEEMGGTWIGDCEVEHVSWDGISEVTTECSDGTIVRSQKLLCAAGRIANVKNLNIDNAGLSLNDRGLITVDEDMRTSVPNIFAAGDIIGPPSLASSSMEQGRRAASRALDIDVSNMNDMIPSGIYAIPELSAVGLNEAQAIKKYGGSVVGRANFDEIARGQISGNTHGMLKLICDDKGEKIVGTMIVGEGATELVHIGMMAIMNEMEVDAMVDSIFNFPTLAEAYRVAALDAISQRP
ncbi:MAG: Si-specific NAD(P)(+) transhydrogenase [Cellvibrionaceae bacterium]|nr:Si-specific NAD(P)(+) transhydrogenase [Cellvibrionaceae bacterium]